MYDGNSPFAPPSLRNVLRRDKAAQRYESDAFQHAGGQGMLFNMPTVAHIEDMATQEQRDAAYAEIQESVEARTTGQYRGTPLVVGDGTEVTTYGVSLRDMMLNDAHAHAAERILSVFQIPPAAVGIRIDRDPTYANARVWEAVAFERGVGPRLREFASRLGDSLLTDVEKDQRGYEVIFRTDDEIRAKLEDQRIHEEIHLNRLREGAVAVWETRNALEGIDPDPGLEYQLQAAHMLRLTGVSPQISVEDPSVSQVIADAIELSGVAPRNGRDGGNRERNDE